MGPRSRALSEARASLGAIRPVVRGESTAPPSGVCSLSGVACALVPEILQHWFVRGSGSGFILIVWSQGKLGGTSSVRSLFVVSPWNKIKELAELHSPSPVQWAGGPAKVGRGGAVRGVRVEKLNFARRLGRAVEIGCN